MDRVFGQPHLGACVASILEIEAGAMPNFADVKPENLGRAISEFVAPFGLHYFEILGPPPTPEEWEQVKRLGFWILRGPSSRNPGSEDAVVMYGAKIAHDPGGANESSLTAVFDGTDDKSLWSFGLFVPFDPVFVRRHKRVEMK